MDRVFISAPYQDTEEHRKYARQCEIDSASRGESPLCEWVLCGGKRQQRPLDEKQRCAWMDVAKFRAFYADMGITREMRAAIEACERDGLLYKIRKIWDI